MTSSTNVSIELTNEDALRIQPGVSRFLQHLDLPNGIISQDGCDTQSEDQLVIGQNELPMDESELHFDVDKGDVIFDYGTQEMTGTPDKIGEHISQILGTVLPSGLQKEAQGRLQAVFNQGDGGSSNSSNDSPMGSAGEGSVLELQDAMGNLQRIQKVKQLKQRQILESKTDERNVCESLGTFKDYGDASSRLPNFSVLISEKRPVCLFCEYCMVFGEPPRNMIKWYNKVNRYDNLPREGERKNKHSRKRNR